MLDLAGDVIIGDRDNNRIQLFDADRELLETWSGFAPFSLALDAEGMLFIADGRANKILRLDPDGTVVQTWGGDKGPAPGEFSTPRMLETDRPGNLYAAEVSGKRVQKLVRQR